MIQRSKEDASASWVNPSISTTASIFSHEVGLEIGFLDMGASSNWGVLNPKEDKRIHSEYDRRVNPFYDE